MCAKDTNERNQDQDKLIQLHMDEHIAEQLSREINNIPQIMPKKPKQSKNKGIMNYFKQK